MEKGRGCKHLLKYLSPPTTPPAHYPSPPLPPEKSFVLSKCQNVRCRRVEQARIQEVPQKILFKIWDQYLFDSDIQEKGIFWKQDSGLKTTKVKFVSIHVYYFRAFEIL